MSSQEVEVALQGIGEQVIAHLQRDNIPVSVSVDPRCYIRIAIGRDAEFSFIVRSSRNTNHCFEVWDWDLQQTVYLDRIPLENLERERVALFVCAAARRFMAQQ